MCYNRKQIIKAAKPTSIGLCLTSLKDLCRLTTTWYAKFGSNTTEVLHHMQLQLFKSIELIPDVWFTSHECKLDRGVIFEHDELYARAWESDFGKPFLGNVQGELSPPNPHEVTIESYHTNAETCSAPGTTRKILLNFYHQQMGYVKERIRIITRKLMRELVRINLNLMLPPNDKIWSTL